jgi:hypothetical protein
LDQKRFIEHQPRQWWRHKQEEQAMNEHNAIPAIGIERNRSRITGTVHYRIVELDRDGSVAGYISDTIYLDYEDAAEDATLEHGAEDFIPCYDSALD